MDSMMIDAIDAIDGLRRTAELGKAGIIVWCYQKILRKLSRHGGRELTCSKVDLSKSNGKTEDVWMTLNAYPLVN
jgi:hypothetical protein